MATAINDMWPAQRSRATYKNRQIRNMKIERLQSYMLNGARLAFDWQRFRSIDETWNRRPAQNALRLWTELGFGELKALVDVGARRSEFASWILRECPNAQLVSFEPDVRFTPLGNIRRQALSSIGGRGRLDFGPSCPCLDFEKNGPVEVCRFDDLGLRVPQPAMLKVDAEDSTLDALNGFGDRLKDFALIIAEVANYHPNQPRLNGYARTALYKITRYMGVYGYVCSRILDVGPYMPNRVASSDIAFWRL